MRPGVKGCPWWSFCARLGHATSLLRDKLRTRGTGTRGVGAAKLAMDTVNTLYAMPALASPSQSNSLESTGNHDTLYTVGWLDLSKGPEVLYVSDMAGRQSSN